MHPVAFEAVGAVAGEVLEQLDGDRPDLLVCFVSRHHVDAFADIADGLRAILEPDVLVGATAVSIAGGSREIEDEPALSVWAADWGGGHASGFVLDVQPHLDGEGAEGVRVDGWPSEASGDATVLLLADPFSFPVADLLALCNARVPGLRVIGGLASAGTVPGTNRLALDDRVVRSGAVGVVMPPEVAVRTIVSQGCRPVGSPFTVTKAERNVVLELGGRSAIARLEELVPRPTTATARCSPAVCRSASSSTSTASTSTAATSSCAACSAPTSAPARSRSASSSRWARRSSSRSATPKRPTTISPRCSAGSARCGGALLFTCNGRGVHLFGRPDHDTGLIDAARPAAAGRRLLRGRDRPDRRPQLPARLHRQHRPLRAEPATGRTRRDVGV